MKTFDEAQALEILIHDAYADVLEIIGIAQSGTGSYQVTCRDRADGMQMSFFHEDDLFSDFGERKAQANEPRAIIRHFAAAMERKLAANDGVKGTWRDYDWMLHYRALMTEIGELLEALRALEAAGRWGNEESAEREAVLQEAADCANYLMMICDVVGALPPTDERGR